MRGRPRPHVCAWGGVCGEGRATPIRQRSRGWRRAGETPAHPGCPRLRRGRARRTSWGRGRPRPHVSTRGGVCGEGRPTRQRSRGWRRAGETPAHPSGPRLRRGRARRTSRVRGRPRPHVCARGGVCGEGRPNSPAFARMETCGRDARAPRQTSARRGYTRKAFMASSPRQLTTFTAMRPEAGRGKGRDVSLFSAAQASGSISAFREVFSALYGSFPPRK